MTCLANHRHGEFDGSCIAFSMKIFFETEPIPAAYCAISISRAKASQPARPYVPWMGSPKRISPRRNRALTQNSNQMCHSLHG